MMLADPIDQMIAVVEALEQHYEALLSVMDKEKQATLASHAEMMMSSVTRRQELMASIFRLETRRQRLLDQIARQLGVRASSLSFSELSKYTNNIKSFKIKSLSASLAKLLPSVRQANDENRALIQHCLQLVRNTLGFFQHWLAPGSVYGQKGKVNGESLNGRLLSGMI